MPSVTPNINVTNPSGHNHHASNNNPHRNYQQSTSNTSNTSNNASSSRFHSQYIDQNSPQSNILPLLNSLGVTINSPQATIIIIPTINSDFQNQLLTYLNHSS